MRSWLVAVIAGIFVCLSVTAQAEKRVALVIGNAAYRNAGELKNPANDAADMAAALKGLGFKVIEGRDLDKAGMDRIVRDFAEALVGADVGLFFYAGHGLQVAGNNYLVPVDAKLGSSAGLDFEMVRLDLVQRQMERETKTNVLILDACRDNPLARNLARAMGTRSTDIGRGLAGAESGVGTLIAFATQPGNVALDGEGRNSPFTGALIKHIATTGQDLSGVLISVRNDVRAATAGRQVPWENSALTGRFYFREGAPSASSAPAPVATGPAPDETTWSFVKDTKDPDQLRRFIEQFPTSARRSEAAARLFALEQGKVAVVAPPVAPTPPPQSVPKPAVGVFPPTSKVTPLSPERERALKPKDTFKECDTCPEMVVVPAGSFTMGSPANETDRSSDEGPQHRVKFSRQFAVGKFAVTFDQFAAFVKETGYDSGSECYTYEGGSWEKRFGRSWRDPALAQSGSHPVVCINWDDAKAYMAWLSRKTGKTYRLLSEAEREYGARAGTTTPYWWGSTIATSQANHNRNRDSTVPVDAFQPNPWGLYQVHGNLWERVEDCYHDSYRGAPTDGSAWTSGDCTSRVRRGGSWYEAPRFLRSALRLKSTPDIRSSGVGFRVARTLLTP